MFNDPQFWVFVAFVIFVGLIFKPVKKFLNSNLDNKINQIKEDINQAEKIKNDAQQTLSDIIKRQNEVKQEVSVIQKKAQENILLIQEDYNQKLVDQIEKRNKLAKVKIEQLTIDANSEIQRYIVKTTIDTTIAILLKKLDKNEKQNLINHSIKELNSVLKN